MALTQIDNEYVGFFDSVEFETQGDGIIVWDRAKPSRFFSDLLTGIFSSGVNPAVDDCFKIIPGAGLSVIRLPGKAFLDGHYTQPPLPRTEQIVEANQVYYYIIRCSVEVTNRCVFEGLLMNPDPAAIPQREENIFDLVLARIDVPAGTTQITGAMITDLRNNDNYCGYMTIHPNINVSVLRITADDVEDTDTRMIPVRTGDRKLSLRQDGTYNNDIETDHIKIGLYDLYPAGENINITISGLTFQPVPKAIPSGWRLLEGLDPSLAGNSIASADNTASYDTNPRVGSIAYEYRSLYIPADENPTDINITARVRLRRYTATSAEQGQIEISLYDFGTNAEIPNTARVVTPTNSSNGEIFTISHNTHEFNITNLGLKLEKAFPYSTYIYGSDITVTYTANGRIIGQFTPFGIVTSPVQPLGAMSQLSGGAMAISAPVIPAAHGTSPETAAEYVNDMSYPYMNGEYMIYNGQIYKCVSDNTVLPPAGSQELIDCWELIDNG